MVISHSTVNLSSGVIWVFWWFIKLGDKKLEIIDFQYIINVLLVRDKFCSQQPKHWPAYLCIRLLDRLLLPEDLLSIGVDYTELYFSREGCCQGS